MARLKTCQTARVALGESLAEKRSANRRQASVDNVRIVVGMFIRGRERAGVTAFSKRRGKKKLGSRDPSDFNRPA